MSQRRRSLQRILRARRPVTTTAKHRVRSVRRKKRSEDSHHAVVMDSFVEDSQASLPGYSVRKLPLRKAAAGLEDVSAVCIGGQGTGNDGRGRGTGMGTGQVTGMGTGQGTGMDVERGTGMVSGQGTRMDVGDGDKDEYNLLESTEELELPCQAESVEVMRQNGDETVVLETLRDVDHAAVAPREQSVAVHTRQVSLGVHTPQPLPPDSDVNQTASVEHAATSSYRQRLTSLPTLQLDGQIDTPATAGRNQSSLVADKVTALFIDLR